MVADFEIPRQRAMLRSFFSCFASSLTVIVGMCLTFVFASGEVKPAAADGDERGASPG